MPAIRSYVLGNAVPGHISQGGDPLHRSASGVRYCDELWFRVRIDWRSQLHLRLKRWNAFIAFERCHG
jgi:hypothetical protein